MREIILSILDNASANKPDYALFFTASLLIIVGILFSYSLGVYEVLRFEYDQFHFFYRQLFSGILSILIMWSFSQIKPDKLLPIVGWSLFGVFLILILFMKILPSSITIESGGATRWIRLPGFSLSPVEFFKVGFVWYLAHSFYRRLDDVSKLPFKDEVILLIPYGIIFLILAIFIAVFQKDLGQTAVIGSIIFMMLVFANRSWKIFVSIIILALLGVIGLVTSFSHRIDRMQSWWGMVQDDVLKYLPSFLERYLRIEEYSKAYQVGHSLNAINNGSLFGEGIGNGYIKLGFLGEVHTDFVLAGIAEEIGFLGLMVIVLIFAFLIIRIFRVARYTTNKIFHLFCIGVAVMIGTSFIINSFGTAKIGHT